MSALLLFEGDLGRRGPQALEFLCEGGGNSRAIRRRGEEVRAGSLEALRSEQGREVGTRQQTPRAGSPGRVHRVVVAPAAVVEQQQHCEARNRLPDGAGGEAHLGEVFGGEWDRDHGRAIFPQQRSTAAPNVILDCYRHSNTFRKNSNRFRIGDAASTVSGGRRTDGGREKRNASRKPAANMRGSALERAPWSGKRSTKFGLAWKQRAT
jgi:hypothetical protein